MKKWVPILFIVCATAVIVYWSGRSKPASPSETASAVPEPAASSPGPLSSRSPKPELALTSTALSTVANPGVTQAPAMARAALPSATTVAPPEPEPAIAPAILLESMRTTVRQYGLMFGGNPVGTNPEITKALDGKNPKQVRFLGPDGNRVNAKGELVDAWGTPYFFHQLSAMEMEIRSAGPDRVMWTSDDLVIK